VSLSSDIDNAKTLALSALRTHVNVVRISQCEPRFANMHAVFLQSFWIFFVVRLRC